MVTTTTCPQCGAPVLTVRTAKNRSLTLDKEPTTDGTIELRGQRARRHVERQHAWDAVVAGLLLHYHAVLGDSEARFPRYG